MPYFPKSHLTNSAAFLKAVAVPAAAAFMIFQANGARSDVFVQADNNKIVTITSSTPPGRRASQMFNFGATGVTDGQPTEIHLQGNESVSDGALVKASAVIDTSIFPDNFIEEPAQRQGPSIGFPPVSVGSSSITPQEIEDIISKLELPPARPMSKTLSLSQRDMYWLAADLGRRFAAAPGVRKSRLDETRFVALFTAVIQRESNFNSRAVSSAGAIGLGQLMPNTALDLGVRDPFSARQNLEGAARYLTTMLDQFGSAELALAAYNAGPGAVRKYGGIPPYRETRQYVSDILHAASAEPRDIAPPASKGDNAAPPDLLAFASEKLDLNISDEGNAKLAFTAVLRPAAHDGTNNGVSVDTGSARKNAASTSKAFLKNHKKESVKRRFFPKSLLHNGSRPKVTKINQKYVDPFSDHCGGR